MPLGRGSLNGRTVLEGRTIQVQDLQNAGAEFPDGAMIAREYGHRTTVTVPLMREGVAVGSIFLRRREVRPFSEQQVALLETFAAQAVIAIENVRLFKELEARNSELTESLARQMATSEVLRAISQSPTDVQPVFDTIVRSAVRLCEGLYGFVSRFDGELIHVAAHHNYTPEGLRALHAMYPVRPNRQLVSGRAILTRTIVHVEDALEDPEYNQPFALAGGWRSMLAVPLLRDGDPIGAILVMRSQPGPFSEAQIGLLRTFGDQAVIAIENVRLFKELEARNTDLTDALARRTATGEILQTIAHAQTDAQPVFDTIVRSAAQLCRATSAAVFLADGRTLDLPANYGASFEALAAVRVRFPRPLDMETVPGLAMLTRSVIHVPDIEDPSAVASVREAGRVLGFRSTIAVPMLREGEAIGSISVARQEPGRFSDAEVALLKTFADQAVIAIGERAPLRRAAGPDGRPDALGQ
jgi:GAF domain-containing protein